MILAAEDDTLPDRDAYCRLLGHLDNGAVFAQGTEVARQFPYIPHWVVTDQRIESGTYDGSDVVSIQGGGWYCAAMLSDVARRSLVPGPDLPLGPDVAHVREMSKHGRCVGDWTVECLHVGPDFCLHPSMTRITQVRYEKHESGRWLRSEHAARGYRLAAQITEDGLLKVNVLKPFIGTAEERAKHAGPNRLIMPGTIMDITQERYRQLASRERPLVEALSPVDVPVGASLRNWAPVTKPMTSAVAKEAMPEEEQDGVHECLPCKKEFPSEAALKAHYRSKSHQAAVGAEG